MKLTLPVTAMDLTRQEQLLIWLNRNSLTYKAIGEKLGIAKSSASRMLQADTMPPHHHGVLSEIIPAELLPDPVYQKPGPKPKVEAQVA